MTVIIIFKITKDNCYERNYVLVYLKISILILVLKIYKIDLPSGGSVEGTGVVVGVVFLGVVVVVFFVVVVIVGSASFGFKSHFGISMKLMSSTATYPCSFTPLFDWNSIWKIKQKFKNHHM